MRDFADRFEVKVGNETVRGVRLTVREIREYASAFASGEVPTDLAIELIREKCRLADGEKIEPLDLTNDQIRTLVAEMTLPKEGRGIADFIGLLC